MIKDKAVAQRVVHCRTGSLEKQVEAIRRGYHVHCRTGSLEKRFHALTYEVSVHCRTGSLENDFTFCY